MAAQAGVDAQRLRLAHTRVLAPDSGVISARTATVGAVVSAGNELFRMLRRGRLEWRAEVTASELHRIQPGIKVRVTPADGSTVEGSVRMVAPTVDPLTRNALVYVDLPAHAQLRAGMFARGEFALGDSEALTVPQEALVLRDGFAYVFVLDARQRVQQRKVQTGRRVADRVEVLSGLDAQASIAVRGAGFLNDGDLVRVVAAAQDVRQSAPAAPAGLSPRGAQ
ncbi:efflux RND transporter periplasmic adaptor subunit, partial [Verminephrobacter aporrectodeae]|uniref:efflux RND transporter periplasmic adaptor subunit n=1 Tax=Verminephrobacter aporrectodeae TaxID=1110389 RepID=UPI0002377736